MNLSDIETCLNIFVAITTLLGIWLIVREYYSKRAKMTKILSSNLKRKIAFVTPDNSSEYNMENEIRIVKSCWVFNEPEHFSCYSNFRNQKDFWMVVIWYKKGIIEDDSIKALLKNVKWNTPILIYTYSDTNRIDIDMLNTVTKNYLIVNFPLRLLWDIFSLMSIHKNI